MSNEAKVEMVPMLQDMRTYITNHYWSEILCEVEEQLPGFKAQMPSCTLVCSAENRCIEERRTATLFRGKHVFEYGFCAGRDDSVAAGINGFIG